jgi:hypothetical protein
MQEAALGAIKPLLTEFCEEELTVGNGSLGGWADRRARSIGSVDSVAVGMRTTSREMGIIGAYERRAGGTMWVFHTLSKGYATL